MRARTIAACASAAGAPSSAGCWMNAYAYWVNPRAMPRRKPTCLSRRSERLSIVFSAKGTASRTSSGSSSRANALPSPVADSASATWLSAYRFGEQASSSSSGPERIARKMSESDIDAAREVNLCSTGESDWTRRPQPFTLPERPKHPVKNRRAPPSSAGRWW